MVKAFLGCVAFHRALIILMLVGVAGCGGSGGSGGGTPADDDASVTPGNAAEAFLGSMTESTSSTIGPAGGALHGTPGTPIDGVIVTFPPGAVDQDTDVVLGYRQGDVTPVDGAWGGLVLYLTTTKPGAFDQPVEITLPFSGAAGIIPVPYYITNSGAFELTDLVDVDYTLGTLTFKTYHASDFTFINALLNDPLADSYNTAFRPELHGFRILNDGGKYNQWGECFGMTTFAYWHFLNGHPNLYDSYTAPLSDGTDSGQSVIASRAHISVSQNWSKYQAGIDIQKASLGQAAVNTLIRSAMRNTGRPIILSLREPIIDIGSGGHSVVAYAFVGRDIFVYDPNNPGQTKTLRFTGTEFEGYETGNGGLLATYQKVYFNGYGSLYLTEAYENIRNDALSGFASYDARISELLPVENTAQGDEPIRERSVTLTGQVDSGAVLIEEVGVIIKDNEIKGAVDENGRFSVEIPLRNGTNYLRLVTRGRNADGRFTYVSNNYQSRYYRLEAELDDSVIYITLTWNKSVDLDLYVIEPDGQASWYSNKVTNNGGTLDIDVTSGYGPEHYTLSTNDTVYWEQPYLVKVHKYTSRLEYTNWEMTVLLNEVEEKSYSGYLSVGDSGNDDPDSFGEDWSTLIEIVPVQPN